MRYDQLIGLIETRGDLSSREQAERATQATLQVLGERLAGGETGQLLAQLPPELSEHAAKPARAGEAFGVDEFARRVGELEGCAPEIALEHAHAVLRTVAETVSDGELEDLQAQLPAGYETLLR